MGVDVAARLVDQLPGNVGAAADLIGDLDTRIALLKRGDGRLFALGILVVDDDLAFLFGCLIQLIGAAGGWRGRAGGGVGLGLTTRTQDQCDDSDGEWREAAAAEYRQWTQLSSWPAPGQLVRI